MNEKHDVHLGLEAQEPVPPAATHPLSAGRRFFTRCHLSVCNMHYPPLAGIDYVSKGGNKNDQELYRLVCVSRHSVCTSKASNITVQDLVCITACFD